MLFINYVSRSHRTSKLNHSITKCREIPFETLSFMHVVATYYDLKPCVADYMLFILKKLLNDYHSLCNGISYENICIATALYAMQVSGMECYESVSVDGLISNLYKPENRQAQTIQVYGLVQTIEDLFYDSSAQPVSYADEKLTNFY